MRHFRSTLMVSLAVSALAISQGAAAQSADSADNTVTTQADQGDTSDPIVVTGYRASLDSAQETKRKAPVAMEAITPADLGKFVDTSIADQLQRVPGVQIDRNNDGRSGDHVSIRGMGGEFVTTTFNGRTPGGYGREGLQYLRQFATDVLPSEILGGAQVYKSTTAEMPESGLGGTVNFDTVRPLDYRAPNGNSTFGSLTVKTSKNDKTSEWGKGVSGVFGAKLMEETLGIIVAGVKSDSPFKRWDQEVRPNQLELNVQQADGSITKQSALFPSQYLLESVRGDQKRTAASVGVQWRPDDHWDVNLDYTYNRFDKPTVWGVMDLGFNGAGTFLPGGVTIKDGAVTGLDYTKYTGGKGIAFAGLFPYQYRNDAKMQMGGANIKWHNDRAFAVVDVFKNTTRTQMSANYAWVPINDASIPANNVTNYHSDTSGITANIGAPQLSGLSNWSTTYYPGQRYILGKNDQSAVRFDVGYDVADQVTIKAGVRYNKYEVDTRDISGNSQANAAQLLELFGKMLPGATDCIFSSAIGANCQPFQDPQAAANINNAYIPAPNFAAAPFRGPFSEVRGTQNGVWNIAANDSHANVEKTKAAYVQADFKGDTFEGNVGLRVVETREFAEALQSVSYIDFDSATTRPISNGVIQQKNTYTDLLPTANFTFHPNEDVNIRLAATKTLSRPEFEDMSPTNAIGVPDPLLSTTTANSVGYARVGNINLKPQTAWNFDFTAEKYTDEGASYVASVFYKSVQDFVVPKAQNAQLLPGYGNQKFNIVTSINASSGRAYGVELGVHQPLKVISPALDGFGVQANYTYVNSKVNEPIEGLTIPFLGASRHNVNAALYYSNHGLDARIAMTKRSSYLSAVPWAGIRPVYLFTDGSTTFDASLSYAINSHLDITGTVSNITKSDRRDFAPNARDFTLNYITSPRVFTFAIRAKL